MRETKRTRTRVKAMAATLAMMSLLASCQSRGPAAPSTSTGPEILSNGGSAPRIKVEPIAAREIARRQEQLRQAEATMASMAPRMKAGDWEQAYDSLSIALASISPSPATAETRARLSALRGKAATQWAHELAESGRATQAKALLREVLSAER